MLKASVGERDWKAKGWAAVFVSRLLWARDLPSAAVFLTYKNAVCCFTCSSRCLLTAQVVLSKTLIAIVWCLCRWLSAALLSPITPPFANLFPQTIWCFYTFGAKTFRCFFGFLPRNISVFFGFLPKNILVNQKYRLNLWSKIQVVDNGTNIQTQVVWATSRVETCSEWQVGHFDRGCSAGWKINACWTVC